MPYEQALLDYSSMLFSKFIQMGLGFIKVSWGTHLVYRCFFIERFWRSLKYEEVYLKGYDTTTEAREGTGEWINTYDHERTHQSLGRQTPEQVYFNQPIKELTA